MAILLWWTDESLSATPRATDGEMWTPRALNLLLQQGVVYRSANQEGRILDVLNGRGKEV